MGSDWSGPRGNLAHYSRPSKHSRRFEARSFWTSYVAEGVADVVQDESGLGGDPPFRNPAQTIAEQVTGRARLPRDPMLCQAPRIHLPNSAVMPLSAPSRCLPRGHGSDYVNRSSVDQANRVDAKKSFKHR